MAAVLPIRPSTGSTATSSGSGTHVPSQSSGNGRLAYRRTESSSSQGGAPNQVTQASVPLSAESPQPPIRRQTAQRPIKSQYPLDGIEQHVEYILVASFDIDRGSIMEHQYPAPVGGDEHMLAELMLPDQAHVRAQDWTIFFLHKDAAADEEDTAGRVKKRRRKVTGDRQARGGAEADGAGANEDEDEDEVEDGDEDVDEDVDGDVDDDFDEGEDADEEGDDRDPVDGPPLVYVLNLVNTKHDTTTRRGAIVKAMAICTRHPFLHIYKPLLLLALEQYFANPGIERLAELFDAVNSMDLSLMPRLSVNERILLWSTDAKDLFLEKFEMMIAQRLAEAERDGGAASGLALSSSAPQARGRFGLPRDTHEFESVVNYANIPVPVKIPTALSPETVGDFSLIKLITTFSTPHTTASVPFSPTHPHLTTSGPLTHPIIVLLNAILTQKRVIFLGHNLPSSDVADAVLGACALASGGCLRGFTRHAFPYTDLTKIDDLLQVPGFIAGVTNPAFANKPEWWDLLCDLSTGRMRISSSIENAPLTEGVVYFQQTHPGSGIGASGGIGALAAAGASLSAGLGGSIGTNPSSGDITGDVGFMADILKAIEERHGENAVRQRFRRWILKFTRLASAFEELVYGASALHVQEAPEPPRPDYDSPLQSPLRTKASAFSLAGEPAPDVTGHGYVWASAAAKTAELAANATRIEGWRNTRSYYNFVQDLAALYAQRPIKNLDLQHLHDKLAKLRLGSDAAASIFLALAAAVRSDQAICQLLSTVSNDTGPGGHSHGLFYIALGLFHARREVREQTAELLARIQEHEAGRHFWLALGRFSRTAWQRVMQARNVRLGVNDDGGNERPV